jgi:hypothetical protein
VFDRRRGVEGDVVARSWEEEILGLVNSGASSIGALVFELSVRVVSDQRGASSWRPAKKLAEKEINRARRGLGPMVCKFRT